MCLDILFYLYEILRDKTNLWLKKKKEKEKEEKMLYLNSEG